MNAHAPNRTHKHPIQPPFTNPNTSPPKHPNPIKPLEELKTQNSEDTSYFLNKAQDQEENRVLEECMAVRESMEEVRLDGLPEGFEEREKRVEEVKGVIDRNGERVREEIEKVERRILEEREVLEGGVERGFDGDERKEEEELQDINAFEIKSKIKHGNPSSNAQEQLQLASDSLVKLADKLKHKSSKEDNFEASKLSMKDSEMAINLPNQPELPH